MIGGKYMYYDIIIIMDIRMSFLFSIISMRIVGQDKINKQNIKSITNQI